MGGYLCGTAVVMMFDVRGEDMHPVYAPRVTRPDLSKTAAIKLGRSVGCVCKTTQ